MSKRLVTTFAGLLITACCQSPVSAQMLNRASGQFTLPNYALVPLSGCNPSAVPLSGMLPLATELVRQWKTDAKLVQIKATTDQSGVVHVGSDGCQFYYYSPSKKMMGTVTVMPYQNSASLLMQGDQVVAGDDPIVPITEPVCDLGQAMRAAALPPGQVTVWLKTFPAYAKQAAHSVWLFTTPKITESIPVDSRTGMRFSFKQVFGATEDEKWKTGRRFDPGTDCKGQYNRHGNAVPRQFPVPPYPGSMATDYWEEGGGEKRILAMVTNDSTDQVSDWYLNTLRSKGWSVGKSNSAHGSSSHSLSAVSSAGIKVGIQIVHFSDMTEIEMTLYRPG